MMNDFYQIGVFIFSNFENKDGISNNSVSLGQFWLH